MIGAYPVLYQLEPLQEVAVGSPFTLELVYAGAGGNYVFAYTPSLEVELKPSYNNVEPPTLWGVEEIWTVTGAVLLGTAVQVRADYDALKARLEDRTDQVTGVLFKKDGVTIGELSSTTHTGFQIKNLKLEKTPGQYTNHIALSMQVRGVVGKEFPGGGDYAGVTKFQSTLSYAYSTVGLLTKIYAGEIRTIGVSAEGRARALGALSLPSLYYRYETNGPEHVDVQVLDSADRHASFRCVLVESRNLRPEAASVYEVTHSLEKRRHLTLRRINFKIAAATIELTRDAVEALRPSENIVDGSWDEDLNTNTCQGFWLEYVPVDTARRIRQYVHSIHMAGGGYPIQEVPTPFGDAILLKTPRRAIQIEETIEFEYYGTPAPAGFLDPFIQDEDHLDNAPSREVEVVEEGLTVDGTVFRQRVTFVWKYATDEKVKFKQAVTQIEEKSPDGGAGATDVTL